MRLRSWRGAASALGVLLVALGAWAVWLEPASLTTDEVTLNLPWRSPRPLRVAVLTDLHVGSPFNGLPKTRR